MLASQSPELQTGDLCPATSMSSLLPCGLISMQVPVTPAKKSFCMGTHLSFINLVSPKETGNSDQLKKGNTHQATAFDQPNQVTSGTHMMVDWSDLTSGGSSAATATGVSSSDEGVKTSDCSNVSPCLALELERTIAELEQTFRQSDPRLHCMSPGSSFEEDYDVIPWADYGFGLAGSEADSIRLHQSCTGGYEGSFDQPSHMSHVHGHYASANSLCHINHVDLSSPETGIFLTDPCSDHDSWGSPESSGEWRWRQSGSDVDDSSSGAGSSFDQVNLHPHLSSQRPPVSALLSSRSLPIPTPDFPLRATRKRTRPCSLTETEDEAEEVLESYPTFPSNYVHHPNAPALLADHHDQPYDEYSELERTSSVKHQPTVKAGSNTVKDRSMSPLTIPSKVLKPGRHSSLRLARRRTSTLYAGCFTLNKGKRAGTGEVVVDLAQDEMHMEVPGEGVVHGPQTVNAVAVDRVSSPGSAKGQRAGQGAVGKERKKGTGRASRGPCCSECGTQSTPVWRAGPCGPKTLCNACGVRFMKMGKKRGRELLAATTQ